MVGEAIRETPKELSLDSETMHVEVVLAATQRGSG